MLANKEKTAQTKKKKLRSQSQTYSPDKGVGILYPKKFLGLLTYDS